MPVLFPHFFLIFFLIGSREHRFKSFQTCVNCVRTQFDHSNLEWFLYHETCSLCSICTAEIVLAVVLLYIAPCREARREWIRRERMALTKNNRLSSVCRDARLIVCALLCLCQPLCIALNLSLKPVQTNLKIFGTALCIAFLRPLADLDWFCCPQVLPPCQEFVPAWLSLRPTWESRALSKVKTAQSCPKPWHAALHTTLTE